MSTPVALRILQIEDSVEDAELTSIELIDAGLPVECRRVENEASLLEALATFKPQLILSDLGLPGFSGTRALQLVREQVPTARFIILSGTDQCDHPGVPGIDGWLCKRDAARLPALIREWFDVPVA
ncbi:MAG: response regulator [Pseudomonadota bacterium]|nr:response regulator [Pseudomonadota bacterium]